MRQELLEVIDDKKQKEQEARIRGMRADFLGIPSLRNGMTLGVLGCHPNQYRHMNRCESCGFGIEYISSTREIDPHIEPKCECEVK